MIRANIIFPIFGMLLLTNTMLNADSVSPKEEGIRVAASQVNHFTFKLFDMMKAQSGNITFSGLSVTAPLANLYEGARDETAQAMRNVMGFGENTEIFHQGFANLMNSLKRDSDGTIVKISNNMWIEQTAKVLDNFRAAMDSMYGMKVKMLNFKEEAQQSTNEINQRVRKETNGEIPILFQEPLEENTRLVLTNAIYFNNKWAHPFHYSYEGDFAAPTKSMSVSYMKQTTHFMYGSDDMKQFVLLPYQDENLATMLVLPKEGQMDNVSENMNEMTFNTMLDSMDYALVSLTMPKFSESASPNMSEILGNMGLGILFDPIRADFSGINGIKSGDDKLSIGQVVHKAVVKMDKGGTVAAAATGIGVVGITSVRDPEPVQEFLADRPFLYFIVDLHSRAIMFMGRINEPSQN